jgi:hypothetical protein
MKNAAVTAGWSWITEKRITPAIKANETIIRDETLIAGVIRFSVIHDHPAVTAAFFIFGVNAQLIIPGCLSLRILSCHQYPRVAYILKSTSGKLNRNILTRIWAHKAMRWRWFAAKLRTSSQEELQSCVFGWTFVCLGFIMISTPLESCRDVYGILIREFSEISFQTG